jgi:serine protease Do
MIMRPLILILSLGAAFTLGMLTSSPRERRRPTILYLDHACVERVDDPSTLFVSAARSVEPAVVHIMVSPGTDPDDPGEERCPEDTADRGRAVSAPWGTRQHEWIGSGVIVDSSGLLLTSAHVVQNSCLITATLSDGRAYRATPIAVDEEVDLAVLRIEGSDFPAALLADSDKLQVGQWVIAIGNPFGLESTVTVGIVSAIHRQKIGMSPHAEFIQTDAAINPGNSGGPLVDLKGRVVGINAAIFSSSGGSQGIGFSIPVRAARSLLNRSRNP